MIPLLLRACQGEQTDRAPIWLMRQAGRYLPEYRKLREDRSLLELFQTPQLAAEVTLQPLRRFELDAAIIFADILTPLIGMGMKLDFIEGRGPVFSEPLTVAGIAKLRVLSAEEGVPYTLAALREVCGELQSKDIPVIGFAGGPFTLAAYMIEGGAPKNFIKTKQFMTQLPDAWRELQQKLAAVVSDYLIAQVRAGARVLQIFDSHLGVLSPLCFEVFVKPYLLQIISRVKGQTKAPVIFFAVEHAGLLAGCADLGADVIGVDWRIALSDANRILGAKFPLQGNLDPELLAGEWDRAGVEAAAILRQRLSLPGHIFNLGHGVLPGTPVGNVSRLVELVHAEVR